MKSKVTYKNLTISDREMLEKLLEKVSIPKIALLMGVNKSTIYRELDRNSKNYYPTKKVKYYYSARYAQKLHNARFCKHKKPLKIFPHFSSYVEEKLKVKWSPEVIVGRYKLDFPNMPLISHVTIYKHLTTNPNTFTTFYHRKKYNTRKGKPRFEKGISIHDRPVSINNRENFHHYEIDCVVSPNHKDGILTLIDRKSRFLQAYKLNNISSKEVNDNLQRFIKDYKVLSFTTDNGSEFSKFLDISKQFNIPFYFCDPYCSSQKGSIENVNKIIRKFYPKGTYFSKISESDILNIVKVINNIPRKILNYLTPTEYFLSS